MKFRITFKDPDGVSDCVTEAVENELKHILREPERVRNAAEEAYSEEINEFIETWVEYGEYLTVEFDTEEGTATVVPVR